jgi:hypothetical protein
MLIAPFTGMLLLLVGWRFAIPMRAFAVDIWVVLEDHAHGILGAVGYG